jgi:hypothetical protein
MEKSLTGSARLPRRARRSQPRAAADRADSLGEELLREEEQGSLLEAREVLERLDTRLRLAVLSRA